MVRLTIVALASVLTIGCGSDSIPDSSSDGSDARRASNEGSCDGIDGDGDGTVDEGFDLATDSNNCGACGVLCTVDHGTGVCEGGSCLDTVLRCDDGYADCDAEGVNGCETELGTSADCGGCGDDCSRIAHAEYACEASNCVQVGACDAGYDDCDGSPANGCETSLETASDCGACGVVCAPASAGGSCAGGVCTVASCLVGYADCNDDPSDGCEQSLSEMSHCGFCDQACDPPDAAGASCATGTCEITACEAGLDDCDGRVSTGCEASLTTASNCGACGVTCAWPNGVGECSVGACSFTACLDSFADCDGDPSNGCETVLGSVDNCAACGDVCVFPNGTGRCSGAGLCEVTGCLMGFADCSASSPGCEVDTTVDTNNCGTCGYSCSLAHATESCIDSACTVDSCDSGWGDCDGAPTNGCETALDTLANCGGCGVDCALSNAITTCGTGTCEITVCAPDYFDCNGTDSDGCESYCDIPHATAHCVGTSCAFEACESNWGDCDSDLSNGCETDLRRNGNCGGCGVTCSGGTPYCCSAECSASTCAIE